MDTINRVRDSRWRLIVLYSGYAANRMMNARGSVRRRIIPEVSEARTGRAKKTEIATIMRATFLVVYGLIDDARQLCRYVA